MTDPMHNPDGDISMLEIGALLLSNRWRVARWTLGAGLLALATVITKPAVYRASSSFAPQGADVTQNGLASIAGQFGVSLPGGGQAQSPDYYARLVKSRSLLTRIAHDTFVVVEQGGARMTFLQLMELTGPNATRNEDRAVEILKRSVSTNVSKTTGIVEVSSVTKWRSVSLAVVERLLDGVNEFNQGTRQSQAAIERRLVEEQLTMKSDELAVAEHAYERFIRANRQVAGSPELSLELDRLQSTLGMRRQLYSALMQQFEELRIREVRDVPAITVIESPAVPALPEPRGRTKVVFLGLMTGAFIGAGLVLATEAMRKRRASGDPAVAALLDAVAQMRGELTRPFRRG